jgi:hypothetical protein
MCLCVSKKKPKSVNYFYVFMKHPKVFNFPKVVHDWVNWDTPQYFLPKYKPKITKTVPTTV